MVTPESADVEASTKELTETVTRDLKDLSHVQVTHFASGSDPNLTIILESFATIMLSAPGQQAQAVQPLGTAAGPAAGPRGAGPGTAMLPGPSTLRRNVPGASGGAGGIGLTPAGNGGPDPTGSAGGAAFNVGSEA